MNKFNIGCAVTLSPFFSFKDYNVGNVTGLTTNAVGELCIIVAWVTGGPPEIMHPTNLIEFEGTPEQLMRFYNQHRKN